MPLASRIVLVGYMGSGKSTVGPLLAARIGWAFADLDVLVETAAGLSVAAIFAAEGEDAFRRRERAAAEALGSLTHHVIAAGGGAFTEDPATRAALQRDAVTVWLRCSLDTVVQRVGRGAEAESRPLARSRERMAATLARREPLYQLADLTALTDTSPPGVVAEGIAGMLRELNLVEPWRTTQA